MTQEEKLEALMQRAVDGGYRLSDKVPPKDKLRSVRLSMSSYPTQEVIRIVSSAGFILTLSFHRVIFSKDFARALFGDTETKDHYGGEVEFYDFGGKDFQYHLMVAGISDDPIGYLYREVFGNDA